MVTFWPARGCGPVPATWVVRVTGILCVLVAWGWCRRAVDIATLVLDTLVVEAEEEDGLLLWDT